MVREEGQLKRLRNSLITGAVVLVPIVITWYVLLSLFHFLDGFTARWVAEIFGRPVPGVGLLMTVAIVLVTGALTTSFIGRELINLGQSILSGTPIVRNVYVTVKQIVDAFAVSDQSTFKRVGMIEYPRRGLYAIVFVTAEGPAMVRDSTGQDLVSVFLPTAPNPTSGFLLLVPRSEFHPLDVAVEDGLKLVVSGGVLAPPPASGEKGRQRGGKKSS